MDDELILDGSDDTTKGSTQTQRLTALKDTMKAALLILDGLGRSTVNDLAKDQEYRDLVHRFLSPLTSLPLHDAIDQTNRLLKNGLDEICRGIAGLFPADDISADSPIHNVSPRIPIPASNVLPSRSQLPTTTTAFSEPSLSPELSLALRQRRGSPIPPLMTPLEQIREDRRKMVTIHFLVGNKKWGTTLKDVVDAFNEVIWRKRRQREQRVLEAWVTKKKNIVLACQSPLDDVHDLWINDPGLRLSDLWESKSVICVTRGGSTEYVARLTPPMDALEQQPGGNDAIVATMRAYLKSRWGNVTLGTRLGSGVFLCSGSAGDLNNFASAPPADISFISPPVSGVRQVYGTMIIGLRLSDDLDIAY